MEDYIKQRLKLSLYMQKQIDWTTIGWVRKRMTTAKHVQGTKLMYGHLLAGHNMAKRGAVAENCPGCRALDETVEHLFQCKNEKMATTIANGISRAVQICKTWIHNLG